MTLGVTVQAITGSRPNGKPEYTCFIVESGTRGFKAVPMKKKMMWRASNTSELFFEDCRVPKENLLGPRGHGFYQMMQTLDGGRLSIAAMGMGGAQGAYDAAQRYACQREQFGQQRGHTPAVQDGMVEAERQVEGVVRKLVGVVRDLVAM